MTIVEEIDSKKIKFIEKFLQVDDEEIINKLSFFLSEATIQAKRESLKPMSENELDERLTQSNDDILNGRVKTQEEVINFIKNRRRSE